MFKSSTIAIFFEYVNFVISFNCFVYFYNIIRLNGLLSLDFTCQFFHCNIVAIHIRFVKDFDGSEFIIIISWMNFMKTISFFTFKAVLDKIISVWDSLWLICFLRFFNLLSFLLFVIWLCVLSNLRLFNWLLFDWLLLFSFIQLSIWIHLYCFLGCLNFWS